MFMWGSTCRARAAARGMGTTTAGALEAAGTGTTGAAGDSSRRPRTTDQVNPKSCVNCVSFALHTPHVVFQTYCICGGGFYYSHLLALCISSIPPNPLFSTTFCV